MPGLLHHRRLGSSSAAEDYRLKLARLAGGTVLVAIVALASRLQRLEVSGLSMVPTLQPGDRVLLVRGRSAGAGDLVVVPDPRRTERLVVKRVVEAGDEALRLAGDNPTGSTDSRQFGSVPRESVRGRVVYRYQPPDRRGRIDRLVP